MAKRPLVLVHGYSDSSKGFEVWKRVLTDARRQPVYDVRVGSYESLTNEISIKDIAEGFDRALRYESGLDQDQEFDAIVHSTGMLVIRSWLATYPARKNRLKHLIALAPATWGSPLAHKGRSWLGSVFKGRWDPFKPDFMEAGNEVLYGLELGSRFTWDLAHQDLFRNDDQVFYGPDAYTPYVFVFCGNKPYGGIKELIAEPGTDGTVRIAGASLNSRKAVVDLTQRGSDGARTRFSDWNGVSELPVIIMAGLDHSTIMKKPTPELVELVRGAIEVEDEAALSAWIANARTVSAEKTMKTKWQQFVVRLVDERGDPVPDYNVRLFRDGKELREFSADVHRFSRDESIRNFHVDVTRLVDARVTDLRLQLIASSGTQLVGYVGYSGRGGVAAEGDAPPEPTVEIELDLTPLATGPTKLFYPFTTTLIEIKLNREPMPLGKVSTICRFA